MRRSKMTPCLDPGAPWREGAMRRWWKPSVGSLPIEARTDGVCMSHDPKLAFLKPATPQPVEQHVGEVMSVEAEECAVRVAVGTIQLWSGQVDRPAEIQLVLVRLYRQ